jgi:trans-aconitate methyltransferase
MKVDARKPCATRWTSAEGSTISDFSSIAPRYRETATVQRAAAERLFDMLRIGREDDVLDLGCGTGHLTQRIRAMTDGVVAGIDPSPGMIAEAKGGASAGVAFEVGTAESLAAVERYDAILCNSALQWFSEPSRALSNCLAALRPGGRMAVQAPARADYCPNFVRSVDALKRDSRTRRDFAGFRAPWLFLESAAEYAGLFTGVGFSVVSSEIEEARQRCTPTKAYEVFESGAAAGYLNPDHYATRPTPAYFAAAREVIARELRSQATADGALELTFFRIYLLVRKPRAGAASRAGCGA